MPDGELTVKSSQPLPDLSVKSTIPLPDSPDSGSHWLSATGDFLKDLASGWGAGATQTITAASKLLNKIPGVGETLAPSVGIKGMEVAGTPRNTGEKIGAGIEQGAELLATGPGKSLAAKVGLGALTGGGSVAVHEAGQGDISPTDVAAGAAVGGTLPAIGGAVKALAGSKIGRGLINESVMANARDVTYGNPAKAILDEGISTPFTGDLEKFKSAIRSGATLQGAAEAAGGRIAAVSEKINEIAPQLHQKLAAAGTNRSAGASFSNLTRIPASTVTNAIDDGILAITKNRGVTAQDAQAAISELQAIKQAALKVPLAPGATATAWAPLEANAVKQEIGQSTNWAGRERVGELVEPIRKQIYSNLKNQINAAAPGTDKLNERLTNLLAAQADVNKLAGFEEVGRGRSAGGVIGPSWMGRIEALAGRYIPAMSWLAPKLSDSARTAVAPTVTALGSGTQ